MEAIFRVAPALPFLRPTRMIERNLLVYRRTFLVIFSGFFEPLFYLVSMGWGVGGLIGQVPLANGREVPYMVFVAPALLGSAAMNGAIYEAGFNFFYKLKYAKTYEAVISTPMAVRDVALGEVAWALLRGSLYAVGFLVVIVAFGLMSSPLGLLAFPASLLIGFAFASVGMAGTTFVRKWQDFDYLQLAILPMFLFSGTFYPLSVYPPALQTVIQVTPLYRSVHLIRALTTDTPDPTLAIDVVYLAIMGLIGIAIMSRRLEKRLLS